MARDIFDPARYTNCSVKCTTNNTDKILNNEKGRLQKVLNKVTQFDPTSKYVAKGKQLISVSNKIYDKFNSVHIDIWKFEHQKLK